MYTCIYTTVPYLYRNEQWLHMLDIKNMVEYHLVLHIISACTEEILLFSGNYIYKSHIYRLLRGLQVF